MLTIGELKEFIKDIPDSTEVRIVSEWSNHADCGLHHECTDIEESNDIEGHYVILHPDVIKIGY